MFKVKFINFICAFLTQNEQSVFSFSDISTFFWASLVAQLVKKSACSVEDLGSIPGEGKGYPL